MALTKPQGNMVMKYGAEVSLSGTSTSFTGIPAGTTMIIVTVVSASTNGTGRIGITIGDSGGLETGTYTGLSTYLVTTPAIAYEVDTGSFRIQHSSAATGDVLHHASLTLVLEDATNNVWVATGTGHGQLSGNYYQNIYSGFHDGLDSALTQLAIVTDGTDTFDAGVASIQYF